MKTVAAIAIATVAAATGVHTEEDYQNQFVQWMHQHDKAYSTEDFFARFNQFKLNFDKIEAHNEGSHSWSMKLNEFADMSADEFKATFYGLAKRSGASKASATFDAPAGYTVRADGVDWRTKNAVTPVKNQGQCGSCWAFSTTGSTEGVVAIASGKKPTPLSEQQLVDCAGSEGNQGCNGGLMDYGFEYIKKNGGLCSESDYPYTARDGSCKRSCTVVDGTAIKGHTDVQTNEKALAAAVDNSPVSVAIEADQSSFQFYSGGIMKGNCGKQLDHGVLAVGYGTQSGTDYWIVKNSWGESWGEQGYIRMERGDDKCGISDGPPSFPTL